MYPDKIKEKFSYMWIIIQSIMFNITNKCNISEKVNTINYMYEDNITFDKMIQNDNIMNNYNIHKQIINFDNKVIAVLASKKDSDESKYYVPISPSALNESYDYVFINDKYWRDYESTKDFLIEFYEISNKEVKCLPKFKITENSLVVGFLTSSNQFVKIDPPREIKDVVDEIQHYEGFIHSDIDKILSRKNDKEDKINKKLTKSLLIES